MHAHKLLDRELWDSEALIADLHDERRDDGKRERNFYSEVRALANNRLDVDAAADLVDIGPHHVHTDTAARHARNLVSGRKARCKDEFMDSRLRHFFNLGFRGQSRSDRLRLDPLGIEPTAIVSNPNDDVPALVIGGEPDRSLRLLAGGDSVGR